MKTNILLILSMLCFSAMAQSQTMFEYTYGTTGVDEASSVRQCADGGYIIGGSNLLKIDNAGIEQWSKPISSFHASTTHDEGFILVGAISTQIPFIKVDQHGDIEWDTHFNQGIWANEGNYIEQTSDSGFIVAGRFQSVTGSGMLLLKLNPVGGVEWRRAFTHATSAGFNTGYAVQQTSDGGYIICGSSYFDYYDSTRHKDVIVLKTDSVGQEQWRNYFGGAQDDIAYAVQENSNGEYLVAGVTGSYGIGAGTNMNTYLMKLTATGDSLWTKALGGELDDYAKAIWPCSDGGAIVAGTTWSTTNGESDGALLKIDSDGNTLWFNKYGGALEDGFNAVQQTTDNGFIVAGYTQSMGAGDYDMYVLKTDSVGNVQVNASPEINGNDELAITIYPNPGNGFFSVKSNTLISYIDIYNVMGDKVFSAPVNARHLNIDLQHQPSGCYFFKVLSEKNKRIKTGKLLIE